MKGIKTMIPRQTMIIATILGLVATFASCTTHKEKQPAQNDGEQRSTHTSNSDQQSSGTPKQNGTNQPAPVNSLPTVADTGESEREYSSQCISYPCFLDHQVTPVGLNYSVKTEDFTVKNTYEFDYSRGNIGEKIGADNQSQAFRTLKPILLSDGRLVVRSSNGDIVWFKDQKEQFTLQTIPTDALSKGSDYPIASLALLADNTIASANTSGQIVLAKDGTLVVTLNVPKIVNILGLPKDQLLVVSDNKLAVYQGQTQVLELIEKSGSISPEAVTALNHDTFAYTSIDRSKSPNIATFKIVESGKAIFSAEGLHAYSILPLPDRTIFVIGRMTNSLDLEAWWVKDNNVVHKQTISERMCTMYLASQPAILSDGKVAIYITAYSPSFYHNSNELTYFKNGNVIKTGIKAADSISRSTHGLHALSDDSLLFFSPSKNLSIFRSDIIGHRMPVLSDAFGPSVITPDGTIAVTSRQGVLQWFAPVAGKTGFFDTVTLTAEPKLKRSSGTAAWCEHSASLDAPASSMPITFEKIGTTIKLSKNNSWCSGESSSFIGSDGKFSMSVLSQECRSKLSGTVSPDGTVVLDQYHVETCSPYFPKGFTWSATDLAK